MVPQQVEKTITEMIHREPFLPFAVELTGGQTLEILQPRLAFDDSGAVFLGPDGALVDFEFKDVRSIRLMKPETIA